MNSSDSDIYEDAQSHLASSPSTSLSSGGEDTPTMDEDRIITPTTETDSLPIASPLEEDEAPKFLIEFLFDLVIHTEAIQDYQVLVRAYTNRIVSSRRVGASWRPYSKSEKFMLGSYCRYEELLDAELKELRLQQLQWILILAVIGDKAIGDVTPSDLYDFFFTFTRDRCNERVQPYRRSYPQLVFRIDRRKSSATILRWHPTGTESEYVEGYGEGSGTTSLESESIAYHAACRDLILTVCREFANFMEGMRTGSVREDNISDFWPRFGLTLFSGIVPIIDAGNVPEFLRAQLSTSVRTVGESLKKLGRGCHIPLSTLNMRGEQWFGEDDATLTRVTNVLRKRKHVVDSADARTNPNPSSQAFVLNLMEDARRRTDVEFLDYFEYTSRHRPPYVYDTLGFVREPQHP